MQISDLQIALIGAGAAGVAMVWGYNVWQDRRHRRDADRIFNGKQPDALLDGEAGDAGREDAESERREPGVAEPAPEPMTSMREEAGAADTVVAEVPPESVAPQLPPEWADEVADCVLHLTAAEPISAPAVRAMQDVWAADCGKALRWLMRNDGDRAWRLCDANDSGRYAQWAVSLQLADRRGPLSDSDLARFFDGVQQVALQTGARLELPSRGETVLRAASLDEFCAAVDIQFVLHVVEAGGGVFPGTKLRGVAEAAGLVLESDGVFRARDAVGGELFSVANLGAERFDGETLKSLATNGLTLSLDVPRVADGVAAFDRMLGTAQQLAAALGGVLVDAQRAALADAMIAAIRTKTAELQQRMNDGGIVPGSVRALRLFS
ncbi:MAG: cell division protein ZipA C-terminal FtsZ-binding domain-containing protein [Rhodocyclales bacterium]|nr:cell division protein ZipA C-terminal FtsZ-binding domain-containing protein [Rhodocyclales bacterium]